MSFGKAVKPFLVTGIIAGAVILFAHKVDGPTGPETDIRMRSPVRINIYHFEAKLIGRPDPYKMFQWKVAPVHWRDTLLIDFDYGPDVNDQKEGDVIWMVSEYNTKTQTWDYWTAEHWKQFRLPENQAWRP